VNYILLLNNTDEEERARIIPSRYVRNTLQSSVIRLTLTFQDPRRLEITIGESSSSSSLFFPVCLSVSCDMLLYSPHFVVHFTLVEIILKFV